MIFKHPGIKINLIARPVMVLILVIFSFRASYAGTKFIPNNGQWPSHILYEASLPGGAFFLERDQITYYFYDEKALHGIWHNYKDSAVIQNHVVRIRFAGSSGVSLVENSGSITDEYYNYFIGNDPSKWVSNVKGTDGITMHNVWPGIDLLIQGSGDGIKYTFKVKPHADPNLIKLQYLGADGIDIDENDTLRIKTTLTNIIEQPPFAYQNIKSFFKKSASYSQVNVQYQQQEAGLISFNIGNYSKKDTLTIDPIVVFATFSGSKADNFGFTGTFNDQGNAYSGGTVYAPGFPTTTGAYQVKFAGGYNSKDPILGTFDYKEYGRDAGILKYSPDGKKLIWGTYLGGSNNEQPQSMIVNSLGELIIYGTTASSNFPTTAGAYNRTYHGNSDIYVCKLSSDGSKLIASTLIGGAGWDGFNGDQPYNEPAGPLAFNYGDTYRGEVIVDKADNILVASCTQSSDLKTVRPFQANFGGIQDGLVMKLSADLSKVIWMSFLGGSGQDAAYGIHLDSKENIFVTGGTQSSNFPTTPGTISPTPFGGVDGFLLKLDPDGQRIAASTYIGTDKGNSTYDQCYLVQTDGNDKVYITGQTFGNFPINGAVYSNQNSRQFIAQLDNDLTKYTRSTVYGSGSRLVNLSPSAFLVDLCGRVYVSGWGGEANNLYNQDNTGNTFGMQVTPDAYQKTTDGSDFYVMILSKDMENLVYASYFGGPHSMEHVDGGTSRFDRNGIVYQSVCGGCGGYSDFPTTPGAYSRKNNGVRAFSPLDGGCNNAFFKIDLNSADFPPRMYDTLIVTEVGKVIDYKFDIVDPQGDSIYVYAKSPVFDPKLVITPATFKADSGLGHITAHFIWTTDCDHYIADTIIVAVTARNNSCPVPRSITHYIRIVMQKPVVPPPPDMFCIEHVDANTVRIRWNPVASSKNLKDVRLVKRFPNGTEQILKISNGIVPDTYLDGAAPDNLDTNFYYFLYTTSACGTGADTGRVAGTVPEKDSIPARVHMFSVSVENNKNIRVIWNKYQKGDFYRYYLYRKDNDKNLNYELYQIISKQTDTTFLDSDVNVQKKSYCYKLVAQSQCGIYSSDYNKSTFSYGCSIVLSGTSIPFEHDLSWNPYEKWDNGVKKYDVIRRDPSKPDSIIGNTSQNITNYKDDSLNYDMGLYWYHVVAHETLDSNSAISLSNEIPLIQAPILYVPNAFTPNNDIRNDKWLTVPVFVKDYHIKVYNRWGECVWQADKKHELWDGFFRGAPASNDCFIWQVTYTGWDSSTYYRTGYVTTLP